MCVLGCGDIVRGVRETVSSSSPNETSFPPPKFEFSQKALRNAKVEFAKSRSRFGDSTSRKYCKYSVKRPFPRLSGVSA